MFKMTFTNFAVDSLTAVALYTVAFVSLGCVLKVVGGFLFGNKDKKRIEGKYD